MHLSLIHLSKKCVLLNGLDSSYEKEPLISSCFVFFLPRKSCQLDCETFNWPPRKTQTWKKMLCIYCATLQFEATLQVFSFSNGGAFPLPKLFPRFQTDVAYLYIWPICTWIKPLILSSSWWAYNDVRQSLEIDRYQIYPLKLNCSQFKIYMYTIKKMHKAGFHLLY